MYNVNLERFGLPEYDRTCAYDRKQKSRGRPPGTTSKKVASKTPMPDSTCFGQQENHSPSLTSPTQHGRSHSIQSIFPIDAGHLDAMQYDFGNVAGSLATSSLAHTVDLTAFSKSNNGLNINLAKIIGLWLIYQCWISTLAAFRWSIQSS